MVSKTIFMAVLCAVSCGTWLAVDPAATAAEEAKDDRMPDIGEDAVAQRLMKAKFSVHPNIWSKVPRPLAERITGGGGGGLRVAKKEDVKREEKLQLSVTRYGSGRPIVGSAQYDLQLSATKQPHLWRLAFDGQTLQLDTRTMQLHTADGEVFIARPVETLFDEIVPMR